MSGMQTVGAALARVLGISDGLELVGAKELGFGDGTGVVSSTVGLLEGNDDVETDGGGDFGLSAEGEIVGCTVVGSPNVGMFVGLVRIVVCGTVGPDVVGATVLGVAWLGAPAVGSELGLPGLTVGPALVGAALVGLAVVGAALGLPGVTVGPDVVGATVLGAAVVGAALGLPALTVGPGVRGTAVGPL